MQCLIWDNVKKFQFQQIQFCQQTKNHPTIHHFSCCHQNANICANANAMLGLKWWKNFQFHLIQFPSKPTINQHFIICRIVIRMQTFVQMQMQCLAWNNGKNIFTFFRFNFLSKPTITLHFIIFPNVIRMQTIVQMQM